MLQDLNVCLKKPVKSKETSSTSSNKKNNSNIRIASDDVPKQKKNQSKNVIQIEAADENASFGDKSKISLEGSLFQNWEGSLTFAIRMCSSY